jgi:lysophospholipid acyltransferase (LPLAT)-like uncharacterized protein
VTHPKNDTTGTESTAWRLARIDAMLVHRAAPAHRGGAARGRNALARGIDALLGFLGSYAPPLSWATVRATALLLYVYARLVALTARVVRAGGAGWRDLPAPCILALWHGRAPSPIAAVAASRPEEPMAILVAADARGDALAMLCRWLGLEVVRGDDEHAGWTALGELATRMDRGARVILTVDGMGPARVVKPGAVALAAATGAPIVPVSTACRPALVERHKWDAPRNPIPFGRIAIAFGGRVDMPMAHDLAALDRSMADLGAALDATAAAAEGALG